MSHVFLLVSTGSGSGLTTISLGMVRALDRLGIRTGFCKPVAQLHEGDLGPERSTHLVTHMTNIKVPQAIGLQRAKSLLAADKEGLLMEEVVELYQEGAQHADVVVVEGLVADGYAGYATRLNTAMAKALDAEVILVGKDEPGLEDYIDIAASAFRGNNGTALIGTVLNKVGTTSEESIVLPTDGLQTESHQADSSLSDTARHGVDLLDDKTKRAVAKSSYLMGCIPWKPELVAPRVSDIAKYLDAEILYMGELELRRVQRIEICARTLGNTLSVYQPHTLLIFPGDREDVFIAACMAALNGVPLAGILLTGSFKPRQGVLDLCAQALQSGLPVMMAQGSSFQIAVKVANMPSEVAVDDFDLIDQAMDHVASHLDMDWLKERCAVERKARLSPAAFRYQLLQRATQVRRVVVLPEGDEPRTVLAAQQCQSRGIAQCILLGNLERIQQVALSQGISLDEGIKIIDPDSVWPQYIEAMVEIRRAKGLSREMAEDQLQDRVVLGTMMLALGEVDGLVSGAVHTTANTVRPAFQLIGTHESSALVSSIFFMCLPDEVVVYGDCAINPDPDAEQLAAIAMQSADSAKRFGIDASVAMISYSTGESGLGSGVEKVREATKLVQQARPDMLVDGPLQYDAAAISSVGKSKAPESKVAGKANVFIFPDLNTGNTTYKAVQRSAHVVSIGPMLQGLNKPVNDLSRGATVEDIVYTIALTAIQAA
ncbi:MAG: phosphate acetyltransferase [Mariprofundaceae bacterium]